MQVWRGFRDWVMPVDFLRLSQDCVEEIEDRVRNSNTLLNKYQNGDLSSKLAKTIENVTKLISNCGESSTSFTPAIRNLYKISEKAKRLVCNCSNEKWRDASLIFQLQNDESFQEILLEMGLCYHVIREQAEGMRGKGDPQIEDLRKSSTFSPASEEKVRKDREDLREVLVRLASTISSSNHREKYLAEYLLRKLDCSPDYDEANELGICTSAILLVKETEPPGTWKYDHYLQGGSAANAVFKAKWLGIPCAKKVFCTEVEMSTFVREAGILYRLSHPNIVNFFCCSNGPEKGQCFIGMELMQMSLSDLIKYEAKKFRKSFPLSVALDIIVQIARGMCYLHVSGIAHRDLKPSNVVVNRLDTPHLDDNFCVKLVDFGMSKTKVEVSKSNTISIPGVGTTRYRAPEVHPKAHNSPQRPAKALWFKADVYSFGVTCAEILSSKTPFEGIGLSDIYRELERGARPKLPSHCPEKLVSLVKECWSTDPRSRPTFIEICTRLEAFRHDLSRGSTSVAHRGLQEGGIDPIGDKYIEEMLRKYEYQRRKHSAEQPDNLHFASLDEKCDVVFEEAREDEGRGSRLEEIWDYEHDHHKSSTGIFPSGAQFGKPLRRDAHSSLPEQALERFQGVVYPQNDPDAVEVRVEDIRTLNPSEFLNDTIIEFYIKYLLQTSWPRERLPTVHVFKCFFFQELAQTDTSYKQSRAAIERVKKWTKGIPIFEKDYIFIPVKQRSHWSLIIICHPGHMCDTDGPSGVPVGDPYILHLDPYKGTHHTGLEDCIKNYLSEEWKERNRDTDPRGYFDEIHFLSANVPQQDNQYDCGIFVLHYVELFLKVAPPKFSLKSIRNLEPNFLRRGWFKPSEASAKRLFIQQLIVSLPEGRSAVASKDAEEARDFEAIAGLAGVSESIESDKCDHEKLRLL